MATIVNNLKPVHSIEQLNQLIAAGAIFAWYSRSFQCGFRIAQIHESILNDHVECVLAGGHRGTFPLNQIFYN